MKWMRGIALCFVFLIVAGCDSTTATEDGELTATPPTLAEVVGERIGTWYGTESLGPEQGFAEFVGWERRHISSCPPEFIAEGSEGPNSTISCLQGVSQEFELKAVAELTMDISVLDDSTLVQRWSPVDLHLNIKQIAVSAQIPSRVFWQLQSDGSWYLNIQNVQGFENPEQHWRWVGPDTFQLLESEEACIISMLLVQNAFLVQDCEGSILTWSRTPWSGF